MKNEDLLKEDIHLILNYHGRSIIVSMKKYKTLVHVKEKVYNLFFPVKHNINIYSNNKNLEPLINQPIGYLFSGASLVNLKVADAGVINTPFRLVNRFHDSFYTTNDLLNKITRKNFKENKSNSTNKENKLSKTNSNRSNKNKKNTMLNKNKLLLLKAEFNNNNINNDNHKNNITTNKKLFNSSSVDNINTKKYNLNKKQLKLPLIQQKNIKNNNNKNNNMNIIYNKCNDCYINRITIYCRLCDKFLCNNCALNKKSFHIEHKDDFLTLIQNSNKANIKQYKNVINKQLKIAMTSFENIGNRDNEKKNKNENEKEEDKEENEKNDVKEEENKDKEQNKENNLNNFSYNEIISNISKNIYKLVDKAQEMKKSLKDIDFSQINDSNEGKINAICENEKKVLRKLDCYEYLSPIQPFFILNTYERNMVKYFNNYGVNNDERIYIKTKIELMFEKVENEVDIALAEINKIIGDKEI